MKNMTTSLSVFLIFIGGIILACRAVEYVQIAPTQTSPARKYSTDESDKPYLDTIYFAPPDSREWKIGYDAEDPQLGGITEYVRGDDEIDNWSELFTFEDLILNQSTKELTAISFFEAKIEILETDCPGVNEWGIIDEDKSKVIYELKQIQPCDKWPYQQHEVGGIFVGSTHTFNIRFTVKTDQMPADAREAWITALQNVKIVKAINTPEP